MNSSKEGLMFTMNKGAVGHLLQETEEKFTKIDTRVASQHYRSV